MLLIANLANYAQMWKHRNIPINSQFPDLLTALCPLVTHKRRIETECFSKLRFLCHSPQPPHRMLILCNVRCLFMETIHYLACVMLLCRGSLLYLISVFITMLQNKCVCVYINIYTFPFIISIKLNGGVDRYLTDIAEAREMSSILQDLLLVWWEMAALVSKVTVSGCWVVSLLLWPAGYEREEGSS